MTAIVDTALSPLLDARTGLAAAVEAATGYTCHPSHETALATPCMVLEGDGWVTNVVGDQSTVYYRMTLTCLYANQAGDLADGVEELARLAFVACLDYGARIPTEVPAPGAVKVGNNDYAGVQFTTTLPVTIRSI
jgi:hypothetical protein